MYKIKVLIFLFFGSTALVSGLYFSSKKAVMNGFVRQLPPHVIGLTHLYILPQSGYYIAGLTDTLLYLASPSNPDEVLSVSYRGDSAFSILPDIHVIKRDSMHRISVGTQVAVHYPYVYQLDLLWSNVLTDLVDGNAQKAHPISSGTLSRLLPLTPDSYIIETFDTLLRTNVLLKVIPSTLIGVPTRQIVLPRQIDGLFCTQGSLTYDPSSHLILFTYLYRNETLALDTNLTIRYRSRTIDPIQDAQITLDTITKGGISSITFSSPPLIVNYLTTASDPYYYINSELMSDNEDSSTWDRYRVIDVYRQVDGSYAFSFYVMKYEGKPVSDFRVRGKTVITLNGPYVLVYELQF